MGKSKHKPLIYAPVEHLPLLQSIFDKAKIPVDLTTDIATLDEQATIIRCEVNPGRQYASFFIERFGSDFQRTIRRETIHVRKNGVVTASLSLPIGKPLPEGIDTILMEEGYFFCGIKPLSSGEWEVRYSNLFYQSFDFDRIQLFSDDAIELRDYIKNLYDKMMG